MLQEIWKKIQQYDKIIIHRHISPDPDALGSQMGLASILRHNYPEKWIKTVGFSEPSLAWMGQMDEVYDEEYEGALVIVTDTANAARIDDNRFNLSSFLIKIDHHPPVDEYGDLNYTNTKAAATCEMIVQLFVANQLEHKLAMPQEAAEVLYTGIIADSGRFLYDSTTPETLECVKFLYEINIDRHRIHTALYKRPLNVVQAEGYVLSHFKTTESQVAYFMMTKSEQNQFNLTTGTRSGLISMLANIENVLVWVGFFENEDGQIRANIRSNGPSINEVASNFNGGGHPKASGAMLKTWDDCLKVIEELNEVCENYQ